jgi:CheY-like chemotaxis protein
MKRILIADDDPAICDAVSMILEEEGYVVSTTFNGETVLKMKRDLPDLLLLDIWMSGVDGRDVARKLKSEHQTKGIPIIMISASRDIEKSAKESGANDFLAKPFKLDDLLNKVAQYIN